MEQPVATNSVLPRLSVLDASAIVIGTIIGAGVFESSPRVAGMAGSWQAALGLWTSGGVLSLIGALCFAELASRFRNVVGGDWVYLRNAFGSRTAFLFAWSAFWVIRPGNIGAMSLTFARYAGKLIENENLQSGLGIILLAAAAVFVLAAVNFWGLRAGSGLLNFLTLMKVVGIAGIIAILFSGSPAPIVEADSELVGGTTDWLSCLSAMVFVMYAFGGWNDVAFVTGEIRNPEKNVFRALMMGTLTVALLYVLLNAGFFWSLGYEAAAKSETVATDAVALRLTDWGWAGTVAGKLTSLLVCISCLGAVNAMLITSPRIFFAAMQDWPRTKQFGGMGTAGGMRLSLIGTCLVTMLLLGLATWYNDAFEVVLIVTAPWFWLFLGLVPIALIVIRFRDRISPAEPDGYRAALYPLPALVLILMCGAMCVSAVKYLIFREFYVPALIVCGIMLTGLAISLTLKNSSKKD